MPFISDALEADQSVLVAAPGPNLAVLADGLGPLTAHVVMTDMTEVGRNPSRILGEVLSRFVEKHPDQPVRMIGEPIWPSRSEVEYPACVQHEVLLNWAFTGRNVTVVARITSRSSIPRLSPMPVAPIRCCGTTGRSNTTTPHTPRRRCWLATTNRCRATPPQSGTRRGSSPILSARALSPAPTRSGWLVSGPNRGSAIDRQ